MADAADVFARITRRPATRYTALVPNLAGLDARSRCARRRDRHLRGRLRDVQPAQHQSVDRRVARELCDRLRAGEGRRPSGSRVCVDRLRLPFEGPVAPEAVADVAAALIEMGAYEVAVSDTIGIAHPGQVPVVIEAVARRVPIERIALHFHDTRGTALANVLTALPLGITTFDASAGGLGGCPYAPGATGNLATEDLLYMLDGMGIETGVSLDKVLEASRFIEQRDRASAGIALRRSREIEPHATASTQRSRRPLRKTPWDHFVRGPWGRW